MNEPTHNPHLERALDALMDIAATVGQVYEGRDPLAFKSLRETALRLDQSALRMGGATPHPAADALAAFADELVRLGGKQQGAALDDGTAVLLGTFLGFDAACAHLLSQPVVSRVHRVATVFERVLAVLEDGSLRAVEATSEGGWVGKYKAGHTRGAWTIVGACDGLTEEWLDALLVAQADYAEPVVALTPMEVYDRLAGRPGIKVVLESGARTYLDLRVPGCTEGYVTTIVWKEDGSVERKSGRFNTWQTEDLVVTPAVVDAIIAHYDRLTADRLGGTRHG